MDITSSFCQFITNSDPANLMPGLQLQDFAVLCSQQEVRETKFSAPGFISSLMMGVTECQSLGVVTSW